MRKAYGTLGVAMALVSLACNSPGGTSETPPTHVGYILGRVLGADGRPVQSALVSVGLRTRDERGNISPAFVRTNEKGEYRYPIELVGTFRAYPQPDTLRVEVQVRLVDARGNGPGEIVARDSVLVTFSRRTETPTPVVADFRVP